MREEWINRIAMSMVLRNKLRNAHMLLDHYGSATEAIAQRRDVFDGNIREAQEKAQKELEFIEKHQIQPYFYKDEHYPYRLAQCVDAPIVLYAKGDMNINPKHAVSIVGTRIPSESGKDWCRRLVLDLAAQVPDLTIISGLAYGIDVTAHRAAIEAGIPTIIIPAHGLDRIYPAVHRNTAIEALKNGGILTEYPSNTTPERFNFVARNRIVAGMADAVVVVESKAKGGSLITADMAIDYGRDVFALPGRYNDSVSEGCNNLIKNQRAQLITNATDLVRAMQWETTAKVEQQMQMVELLHDLTPTQQLLLEKMREGDGSWHINLLVMETQLTYTQVASELMMMEINGVVKGMPGGMWRIIEA